MEKNTNNIACEPRKRKLDNNAESTSSSPSSGPTTASQLGGNNASLHGISYQLRLGLVILLRNYMIHEEDGEFEFTVTFEDPAGGKFDDILVRYSSPKHGSGAVLIQAKHRQPTGKSISNDSLTASLLDQKSPLFVGKYFKSFLDTYRRGSEETQIYMICTNRRFSCTKHFKDCDPAGNASLSFLQAIHAQCFQLDYQNRLDRIDEELRKVNVGKIGKHEVDFKSSDRKTIEENIQHFYNSFLVVCGSANDEELESLAMNLLRSIKSVQSDLIYKILHYLMFEAIKAGPVSYEPRLLKHLLENIECMPKFEQASISTKQHLEALHLKYTNVQIRPDKLAELNLFNFITNETVSKHYYYSSFSSEISTMVIEQTAKLIDYEMLVIDCASFQEKNLICHVGEIISAIDTHCSDRGDSLPRMLITIICRGKSEALLEQVNKLSMKVIMVVHMEHAPFGAHSGHQSVDRFTVADLTENARKQLYEQHTSLNLFGTSTSLNQIVDENDTLERLFDILDICNKEKDERSDLHAKQYERIEPWYIHRKYYDYRLYYYCFKKTYIENDPSCLTSGKPDPKVTIWVNEAGFGKSTYFTWLCWNMSTNNRPYYVVRLNAGPYSTDFKLLKTTNLSYLTDTDALKLLYRFLHLAQFLNTDVRCADFAIDAERTATERCAELLSLSGQSAVFSEDRAEALNLTARQLIELRHFREKFNQEQIVLVLDAFDEIAPDYKEIVLLCLKSFSKLRGIKRMHISSRPFHFHFEFLRTFPDCVMYRFDEFSESDQKLAIEKYLDQAIKERREFDGNFLLQTVNDMFSGVQRQLKEVPLYLHMAFRMFFDTIVNKMKSNRDVSSLQVETMDSLRLIEMFVEEHLRRLFIEKQQRPATALDNSAEHSLFSEVLANRRNQHALLAIFAIFSNEDRNMLLDEKQQADAKDYMKKIEEATEKTGIIQHARFGVPSFSLRILAEYFAALWFYKHKSAMKNQLFFRWKSFWIGEQREVRKFFDQMILSESKGCEIHAAILNLSEAQVVNLLSANPDSINTAKDAVGRLPIHLAVIHFVQDQDISKSMVCLVLEKMAPALIDHRDDLLGWTALDYAFVTENKVLIDLLLAAGAQVNVDTLHQQLFSKGYDTVTFLHTAHEYSCLLKSHAASNECLKQFHDKIVECLQGGRNNYHQLSYVAILEFCIRNECFENFKQYAPDNSLAQHLSTEEKERLFWFAFEHMAVEIISHLIDKCNIPIPQMRNESHVVSILNNIIAKNSRSSSVRYPGYSFLQR
uniref:ANK_REP_REGION domain-containing protein n=1 Tax=Anopheles dirus TaxID=7168 RepID=A0A182NXH6_9DIPT